MCTRPFRGLPSEHLGGRTAILRGPQPCLCASTRHISLTAPSMLNAAAAKFQKGSHCNGSHGARCKASGTQDGAVQDGRWCEPRPGFEVLLCQGRAHGQFCRGSTGWPYLYQPMPDALMSRVAVCHLVEHGARAVLRRQLLCPLGSLSVPNELKASHAAMVSWVMLGPRSSLGQAVMRPGRRLLHSLPDCLMTPGLLLAGASTEPIAALGPHSHQVRDLSSRS